MLLSERTQQLSRDGYADIELHPWADGEHSYRKNSANYYMHIRLASLE